MTLSNSRRDIEIRIDQWHWITRDCSLRRVIFLEIVGELVIVVGSTALMWIVAMLTKSSGDEGLFSISFWSQLLHVLRAITPLGNYSMDDVEGWEVTSFEKQLSVPQAVFMRSGTKEGRTNQYKHVLSSSR